MVAALAVIIGFIVLGLGTVFLAMSGGRGGAGRHGPSRAGRRAVLAASAVVIAGIGIVVPALVLADNGEQQAASAPGGVDLNAEEQEGRSIFARQCATCHTLKAANAVGRVGPNLDALRPPKGLTLDAIAKGRARGRGQMPAELVDGADADRVAAFVAKVAGR